MAAGVDTRHARSCRSRGGGGRCNCTPTYQAHVFDNRSGKRIRKTFPSKAAARTWRQDALVALRTGKLTASRKLSVRQAAEGWLAAAEAGVVTNRSGDPYKPSAIRSYEASLRLRVLDELGDRQFAQVTRGDLQRLVDQLVAQKLSPSTVQCSLLPLRAMYRRAISLDEVTVNPTTGLKLPAIRGGRDKIVTPQQAVKLIEALPTAHDRALWGTALYAGLRRGELLGLMWEDVNVKAGQIHVQRSWDIYEGHDVGPKSAVGRRKVPIASALKALLAAHRLETPRSTGHVFGTTGTGVAAIGHVTKRADDAWRAANERLQANADERGEKVDPAALLERITLHEARHTYASLMIAAGVNAKALSTYMGHANISITLDRYGHLMPGNEAEAATLLDAYLEAAHTA